MLEKPVNVDRAKAAMTNESKNFVRWAIAVILTEISLLRKTSTIKVINIYGEFLFLADQPIIFCDLAAISLGHREFAVYAIAIR